jgi:CDP-glucose 4,6-dehydratase
MKEHNILVTGAGGFIGQVLVNRLSLDSKNCIVGLAFDQHTDKVESVDHLVYGDIRDISLMQRIIGDYEINTVYHLAAQSIVRACARNPVSAYEINVMGTVSLLEACRAVGGPLIKKVVVSTSDKAYGHAPSPYVETTPLDPKFTYEASKTCQDIIARSYAHNYDLPVVVARCSNVYGPGDKNISRLIPRSIQRIASGEAPILYNGVHNYIREFIYIDDVVSAFIILAEKGMPGEAYCVGGTGQYSILELINTIVKLMNANVAPIIEDKDSNFKEIEVQYIDSTKLQSLGWKPQTTLEVGLVESIKYYTR